MLPCEIMTAWRGQSTKSMRCNSLTFRVSSCPTGEHEVGQSILRNGPGGYRSYRPRTSIFHHLLKSYQSFNFLTKNIDIIHLYVLCGPKDRWKELVLDKQSGGFGQLQGIFKFKGCPARIKQCERRCKKKQGMDEYSIVLEVTVNKTPVLRNLLSLRNCG